MVAVTVITAASLPLYSILFRVFGVLGLAWASDIGIALNLLTLAVLLHYKRLVSLSELRWRELGKAAVAAAVLLSTSHTATEAPSAASRAAIAAPMP